MNNKYVIKISCKDTKGIVAAVSGILAANDCFIIESAQFGDLATGKFFMRMVFEAGDNAPDHQGLEQEFADIVKQFDMEWGLYDADYKPRVAILVSKQDHCLNDLLHRYAKGDLQIEIPVVISNHTDTKRMAEWHGIDFVHLPVTPETKMEQETEIWKTIKELDIDLVVLARYMQILTPSLVAKLYGRVINIHHSFLPSFKGARPYHQAHSRGVKIIGATAHFVNDNLDEGPIIEQEVIRVDHTHTPKDLIALGGDIEAKVLSRAVKYFIENRLFINGNKTVLFK